MRWVFFLLAYMCLLGCTSPIDEVHKNSSESFTGSDILRQLDQAFYGLPNEYYPAGRPKDIKYNFFLDLEHGYCVTAGNRIHLYGDRARWAIVFEKSGYQNRSTSAQIELDYVGNCIDYPVDTFAERNYITNSSRVIQQAGVV